MNPDDYAELVTRVAAGQLSVSDSTQCASLLGQLNRLRSWVESSSLAVTARLNDLAVATPGIFPEQMVADATRVSLSQAIQPFRRAAAVELLPEFSAALSAGAVNVDHVDVLARSIAGLDDDTKLRLAERDDFLTDTATRTTSGEFARTLRTEIRRAQRDDGIDTLQRQRRNTRLRTWVDRETGMWCLRGEFDPETGAILETRLNNAVEALFHDATPDTCPSDLIEKQHHLRALALFSITAGKNNGRSGSIDMSILIDSKTLVDGAIHDHSVIDCGLGIELPIDEWLATPTSPRSSSAQTASTSSSNKPLDWPTAHNDAPYEPCTKDARCRVAASPGIMSSSTTSSTSATVGRPTSPTCFPSATNTTTSPTKAAGGSVSMLDAT